MDISLTWLIAGFILVIAELYWIELRYQRFKLLWQTGWLN